MPKKNILPVLIVWALALMPVMLLSKPAFANFLPSASSLESFTSSCLYGSNQYQKIAELKNKIATAKDVNLAREMALAPTDDAIEAIQNARGMIPFSDDLRLAESQLNAVRSRILVASSQAQVADEFSGMMLAGLDEDRAARVDVGKVDCVYSTGEIIAIVIGLILGIIPGLILLVVLC